MRAQGLKYREIADELGITVGSVGKALSDARRYAAKSAKATG
ncbi:sigma-70 region 4 domain-containing protein [Rhodococcus sp. 11-3]|nr:sigma-70 region 4 domain-containing protein [Rhodococcus sp. 11-3]